MPKNCQNCGTSNDSKFCTVCGQAMDVKLLSVRELISETLEVFYNVDSRLWQTLVPLLFAPGKLTSEYVAGRRARYIPPFRTYLIFSLLLFAAVSFDDVVVFERGTEAAGRVSAERMTELVADLRRDRVAETPAGREVIRGLGGVGVIPVEEAERLLSESSTPAAGPATGVDSGPDGPPRAPSIEPLDLSDPASCARIDWDALLGTVLADRAQRICEQTLREGPDGLLREFLDNIPVLVFISLPLVAGFMKLLYWVPPRRYLEHLTFLFHTHAFFFAFLLLVSLGNMLAGLVPWLEALVGWLGVVGAIYVPVYLFIAMRRVYRQGRVLTALKYCVLGPIYLACLMTTFIGGVLFAVFTI